MDAYHDLQTPAAGEQPVQLIWVINHVSHILVCGEKLYGSDAKILQVLKFQFNLVLHPVDTFMTGIIHSHLALHFLKPFLRASKKTGLLVMISEIHNCRDTTESRTSAAFGEAVRSDCSSGNQMIMSMCIYHPRHHIHAACINYPAFTSWLDVWSDLPYAGILNQDICLSLAIAIDYYSTLYQQINHASFLLSTAT